MAEEELVVPGLAIKRDKWDEMFGDVQQMTRDELVKVDDKEDNGARILVICFLAVPWQAILLPKKIEKGSIATLVDDLLGYESRKAKYYIMYVVKSDYQEISQRKLAVVSS